jgi:hypothetical protein
MDRVGRTDAQHRANVSHSYAVCSSSAPGAAEFDNSVPDCGQEYFPVWPVHADDSLGETVVRDRTGTGRDSRLYVA